MFRWVLLFAMFSMPAKAWVYDPYTFNLRLPAAAAIEAADDKPWGGQAELSFLSTMGNTDTLSVGIKTNAKRNWQYWAVSVRGEYLQTRDGEKITAESYLFALRGIRKFKRFDLFLDNEYQRNEFAGFKDMFKFALGIGKELYRNDHHTFRLEGGPAFVIEKRVTAETVKFASFIAQALHKWTLSDKIVLDNRLGYMLNLTNATDSRYELESSFTAPVSSLFSLKAGYLAQYRNEPPKNAKNFDGKTSISLLATF